MKGNPVFCKNHDHEGQTGQSIVIIALALVGLLAFVGIAVDVGFVFARTTQLQSAVDSAALAAVVELVSDPDDSTPANLKATQFFNTNGFDILVRLPSDTGVTHLGDGRSLGLNELGEIQYELTATWPVDLFFLRLIGQQSITLTRVAVAGVFPMADIYASRRIEDGVLSTSNQAVFGPESCTSMGDPFSPLGSPWAPGSYTYNYRILIPPDYPHDIVRVELFDPDSINRSGSSTEIQHTQQAIDDLGEPLFETLSCPTADSGLQYQPCLISTGEASLGDQGNPFWFVRIDENRRPRSGTNSGCGAPPGNNYTPSYNTQTTFELFYWAQNADGTLSRIPLATYTGQVDDGTRDSGDHLTDMQWVSPGGQLSVDQPAEVPADCGSPNGGDYDAADCSSGTPIGAGNGFEVSISQDLGNILTDPATNNRFIYLDVTAISGSSENGYEIWAGPNAYVNDVPSDANRRNLYILDGQSGHRAEGVTVFGMGRLPLNSNVNFRVDIPLIYVGPESAGQTIYISLFDSDSGAQPPIHFFFDSIARADWEVTYSGTEDGRCQIGTCNNLWVDPAYEVDVPGDLENCDYLVPGDCTPFYGGRLVASYDGGSTDTYGWQIRLSGQPYLIR
ncbi:MAG: hypothetical protein H6664_00915 [Ardenticatenaceae bacterium]|nr:hypothetical protein [Ardenticatenaceae bacterium]